MQGYYNDDSKRIGGNVQKGHCERLEKTMEEEGCDTSIGTLKTTGKIYS